RAVAARLAAALRLRPQGWARLDATALGQDAVAAAALAQVLRLLSGHEHAPGAAAVSVLLARGQGTLHGVQWRDDILCREPAACAPPVPALPGACWDGRWRVRSAPAGAMLGALGAAASSLGRRERGGMPALVLAGLPALWWGERVLGAPGLGLGAPAELVFAPVGGPLG
ncbi:MAG: tRNA lysidine(34) synthetase TilS, partial [Roseomonas sp.]|nr:tRNA lysidine(34) synthetase TilS [Roseomonas sp.]